VNRRQFLPVLAAAPALPLVAVAPGADAPAPSEPARPAWFETEIAELVAYRERLAARGHRFGEGFATQASGFQPPTLRLFRPDPKVIVPPAVPRARFCVRLNGGPDFAQAALDRLWGTHDAGRPPVPTRQPVYHPDFPRVRVTTAAFHYDVDELDDAALGLVLVEMGHQLAAAAAAVRDHGLGRSYLSREPLWVPADPWCSGPQAFVEKRAYYWRAFAWTTMFSNKAGS
jgi:hypothetical protein